MDSSIVKADISPVVDAYIHALTAKFPRARYPVGSDVAIALTLQMLPEWISDWLVHIILRRINSYPIPAACKRN